jgi:hypothetical protein
MSGGDEIKSVKAIESAKNPEDDTITLSTGVVLRGKQVPTLILVKLMAAFPRPKAPTWINPNMGREMENPDDPDYLERIKAWKVESSNVTLNALILLGTELVKVPKKMSGPDEDDWVDEYKLLGLPMYPENKSWRYLTWITFRAAPDLNDLNLLKEVVGRLSGIPENKVEAAETFPGSDQAHR